MNPTLRKFLFGIWPFVWPILALAHRILPPSGPIRRLFEERVFWRPWRRWYRYAYVPEYRNVFFAAILTFLYRYPVWKGDVVVQVGASGGEEAIRFARAVGPGGRLIAVEPEPGNVRKLKELMPPDRFPQVTVVSKGAWNASGEMRFFVGGEKEHRLAEIPGEDLTYEWWGVLDHLNESRYRGVSSVSVDTLDSIARDQGLSRIDFVLFETNGAELEGVMGMETSIRFTRHIAARGHVRRDGVPINLGIAKWLTERGFDSATTSEGMVLARPQRKKGGRPTLEEELQGDDI